MTDTEDRDRIAQVLERAENIWVYSITNDRTTRLDHLATAILPLLAEARQQGAREAAERIDEAIERWISEDYAKYGDQGAGMSCHYAGMRRAKDIARQEGER